MEGKGAGARMINYVIRGFEGKGEGLEVESANGQ